MLPIGWGLWGRGNLNDLVYFFAWLAGVDGIIGSNLDINEAIYNVSRHLLSFYLGLVRSLYTSPACKTSNNSVNERTLACSVPSRGM